MLNKVKCFLGFHDYESQVLTSQKKPIAITSPYIPDQLRNVKGILELKGRITTNTCRICGHVEVYIDGIMLEKPIRVQYIIEPTSVHHEKITEDTSGISNALDV